MPTHGSLTKAGKVRSQTPKLQSAERASPIPRFRVRRNYEKRVTLKRAAGQNVREHGRFGGQLRRR
ncbi:MAG: 30S ribosomal protein S30e [Candidatus Bathyarchaeia archaeon]